MFKHDILICVGKSEIVNYILRSPLCQRIESKHLENLITKKAIQTSSNAGFGFSLTTFGCRITKIENDSVAERAGFCIGDKILEGRVLKYL